MLDRRTFIKAGACGGATVLAASTPVGAATTNPSGVGGYDSRLPKLAKGSRLLFLGDSIIVYHPETPTGTLRFQFPDI